MQIVILEIFKNMKSNVELCFFFFFSLPNSGFLFGKPLCIIMQFACIITSENPIKNSSFENSFIFLRFAF